MNTPNRLTVIIISLFVTMLGLPTAATAGHEAVESVLPEQMERPDGFPERPLTIFVPYGPGGGSAQVTTAMAQAVQELTGVGITVQYKPGGAGMVGLGNYMATPADGYTILEHIDDLVSLYASAATDVNPAVDLVPLVTSQITFHQIYIRSNETRYTDWDSFVEWVRAQDGKATIANVSREGSNERVSLRGILDHFGLKMQQISFDKPGPQYASLKGGQTDSLLEQPGDVRGFIDSGDFKPILTFLNERPQAFSDVPSLKDVGMNVEPVMRFRGFYVKMGIPEERLKWLQWAFQKAYFQQSYQTFNKSKFMDVVDSFRDTDGSVELIQNTYDTFKRSYEEMGLIK